MDPKSNLGDLHELYSVDNPDANTVIYNYRSYNQAVALYNAPGQDQASLANLKPYIDNNIPVTDVYYFQLEISLAGGLLYPSIS